MQGPELESMRALLCALGSAIRDQIVQTRGNRTAESLREVVRETDADSIFAIDRVGEDTVVRFLRDHWPAEQPVEVVMEGIETGDTLVHPVGTAIADTRWKMILDPIDGTRGLIYDKRPAWSLCALAPQRGSDTSLADAVVAAMTELPVSKQDESDQVSGVRGAGGVVGNRSNVRTRNSRPVIIQPSRATDLSGGYACLSRFFPEGKTLLAEVEERFLGRLFPLGEFASPFVFEDQYASTGGQMFELMSGRDRMIGDLRPLVFRKLGYERPLACHPYDICTAMLLEEVGGVILDPRTNQKLAVPLDTTTSVAWVGFANQTLADHLWPILRQILIDAGWIDGR